MGNDWVDRVMSNDKATHDKVTAARVKPRFRHDETLPGAAKPVTVIALEIDDNDDFGGDPYNHTGSFCVPEFGDD